MKYANQAKAPEWYQSDNSKTYKSATSGSSPFNEWYEFDDRADALQFIHENFNSQTFVDQFIEWKGEYYYECYFVWDGDIKPLEDGAVADLQDMINAESRF